MPRTLPALLLLAATASAGNWPQFRGPDGQGHAPADETGLPVEWSAEKNVAWAVDVPGGWSSPVVWGDRIFLTAAVPADADGPEGTVLSVLCLSTRDGRELWRRDVFRRTAADDGIHYKNSHASPTPVTDGASLWVHFGTHGTARLACGDGRVLWTAAERYEPRHGPGNSPVLVDPTPDDISTDDRLLFVNCDGEDRAFVVAYDAATGAERWRRDRPAVDDPKTFSFATPLAIRVGDDTQIVSPATDQVIAYRAADGEPLWRVGYNGFSVTPRPVYGHGLVYVATSFMRPEVIAIDPTGRGEVTESNVAWSLSKSAPNTPSPLLVGDELYFVSDRGVASCVDAKTGDAYWVERLGGNFSASPTFADGRIYWQDEDGLTVVTAPGTEYRELARNTLPGRTLATLAVSGGAIYLRTDETFYKLVR